MDVTNAEYPPVDPVFPAYLVEYARRNFPIIARILFGPPLRDSERHAVERATLLKYRKRQELDKSSGSAELGNAVRRTRESLWDLCHIILRAEDLPMLLKERVDLKVEDVVGICRAFPLVGRWLYGRSFTESERARMKRILRISVEVMLFEDLLEPYLDNGELEPIRAQTRYSLLWGCAAKLDG